MTNSLRPERDFVSKADDILLETMKRWMINSVESYLSRTQLKMKTSRQESPGRHQKSNKVTQRVHEHASLPAFTTHHADSVTRRINPEKISRSPCQRVNADDPAATSPVEDLRHARFLPHRRRPDNGPCWGGNACVPA